MKYEYGEPMTKNTCAGYIYKSGGLIFAHFSDEAKLHRVTACINACAGLTNEQLEKIGLGGVQSILAERDQLKSAHELDVAENRLLRQRMDEPNRPRYFGPTLTPAQAADWEWTGEQPRKLTRGESGLCEPRHDNEREWIMGACPTSKSTSFYWPLRRRQAPKADESPNPQNATLSDIAGLLQRILDRMPKREVE